MKQNQEENNEQNEDIDFSFSEKELFYAEKASQETKELILNKKIKPFDFKK